MKIDIVTLFPDMFAGPFDESIIKRARDKKLVEIKIHDLRKWTHDRHKTVDGKPYGGGPGMILKPQPVFDAVEELKMETCSRRRDGKLKNRKIILLTPQGKPFKQEKAQKLSKLDHLILIAGHYEGFDERIRDLVDEEISIGDYVLTGGELPAMVVVDSVVRLIPGVVGSKESLKEESHSSPGYIEYPQYTRPEDFKGKKVPEVLLSGNHAEIDKWRKEQAVKRTKKRLLNKSHLESSW